MTLGGEKDLRNGMKNSTVHSKTLKDLFKVFFSNLCTLASGILVGFFLPKILGDPAAYGHYKTFTLYATYVGLFHFGIEDGIYLAYGGKDYDQLNKTYFRFYSRFLIFLEFIVAFVLALVSIFLLPGELRFIFTCLAVYLFACNVVNYYRFISQITCRFDEYSIVDIIRSVLLTLGLFVLWLLRYLNRAFVGYRFFIVFYVAIYVLLASWYLFAYRDITFGRSVSYREGKENLRIFLEVGFPLMVANLCSTLILTIDRQFVNVLFDTETYGIYAFAYNMVTLITTAISAISTVLYPSLKRSDESTLTSSYSRLISVLMAVVFAGLCVYFPLVLFVNWFLPQYAASLVIFRIILPGIAISAPVTIIMHNYYKALDANMSYFIKSGIVLILSIAANTIAYLVFHSTLAISIASIIVMLIWYVLVEHYFISHHHVPWRKNLLYLLVMLTVFYAVTCVPNIYIAFAIYIVAFASITLLFFFKGIREWRRHRGEAEKTGS